MGIGQQLRVAARQWARQPRLAATAVLTLALGIGGATTMYVVLKAIVRFGRPTVRAPEEVARLFVATPQQPDSRGLVGLGDYRRLKEAVRSLEELAAYASDTRVLRSGEGGDEVETISVTPEYLAIPKAPPVIGRFFDEEESRTSGGRLAVLGEAAWRSRFGADPGVLGRTIDLDDRTYTVIGVTTEPLGLVGSHGATAFVPLDEAKDERPVLVMGRRRAHVSWNEVRAEMAAIGFRDSPVPLQVNLVPIMDDARFRTRAGWLVFVGPALLVLLIGCGNVANLLLVRAIQREREMATRIALGASRAALALQVVIEAGMLAVAGGALGAVFAVAGVRGVRAMIPVALDFRPGIDARALLFVVVATLVAPLVFGAASLLHGLRTDLSGALRAGLTKPLLGCRQYHLRDVFAILEVALSVALVMFTFMLLSMFAALRGADFSFDADGLVLASVRAPEVGTPVAREAAAEGLPQRLRERMAVVPGVERVTVGDPPSWGSRIRVGSSPRSLHLGARLVRVDAAYFDALRLRIVRGRAIDDGDGRGTAAVGVVSEWLAARLWPQGDALGRALWTERDGKAESVTIVGVAGDALRLGRLEYLEAPRIEEMNAALYRHWAQGAGGASTLIARVHGQTASLFPSMIEAARDVDPALRVRKLVTLRSTLDLGGRGSDDPSWLAALLLGFGALATLLSAVGVFGVMGQLVNERRPELGVRFALGASPGAVLRSVVGDGLIRVGLGAGMAVVGISVVVRLTFSGFLRLAAADPRFWLATVGAVAITAVAACYWPARRAGAVDPMEVLRCE
jgi:putative ABC transport system permease protein